MKYNIILLLLCMLTLDASARIQIRRVGSTTILPLTHEASDVFVKETGNVDPLLTANGSGAGIKEFCSAKGGIMAPDVVSASRLMKKEELETCFHNGITNIIKVTIARNGLCFLHAKAPLIKKKIIFSLTPRQVFLAFIKEIPTQDGKLIPNSYKNWNEIDSSLPKAPIKIHVPPTWHGTRGDFEQMVLEPICESFPWVKDLKIKDPKRYAQICHTPQENSEVIIMKDYELGDNGNVLIDIISTGVLGEIAVIGYNIYKIHENRPLIPLAVNHIESNLENLRNGTYPLIYPLQMYFNKDHFKTTQALEDFFKFYSSQRVIGPQGILIKQGIIPIDPSENPISEITPQNPNP